MNSDRRPAARRERGAVAILVAVSLFALLGAGAFALDFGRWLVVKNELQNASDASALAGRHLFPPVAENRPGASGSRGGSCKSDEQLGEDRAVAGDVVPGYWISRIASSTPSGETRPTMIFRR